MDATTTTAAPASTNPRRRKVIGPVTAIWSTRTRRPPGDLHERQMFRALSEQDTEDLVLVLGEVPEVIERSPPG
jgi:hypothetical protein